MEKSIEVPNSHFQFSERELGICTPYKPNKVVNLKKFKFDKASGKIVQQ